MTPPSAVPPFPSSASVEVQDPMVNTHAERRLCAGTYLDREFRDRALREVYNARDKRVAPSSGFDVIPVLHHAWRAWWLETGQYLGTFAVLAIGLVIAPLDTAIAVDVLAIWWLSLLWLRWAAQFVRYGEAVNSPELDQLDLPRDRRMRMTGKVLKFSMWFASAALLVLIVSSVAGDRTGSLMARLAGTGLGAAAVIVGLSAVVALRAVAVDICLARLRSQPRPRRLSRRMRAINRQQHHPVVVHSGHKPFVGSGKPVRSWSFVQRLVSADPINGKGQEFDRPPFPARKLVDRLKSSILGLCEDRDPETRLPGLSVTDWVFVHGANAAPLSRVMAADAGSDDVNKVIADAIASPGDAARHYLAARVVSWGGDVVTSVFVHVSLQGRTLYLEFATYALFPVKTEYVVPGISPRTIVSAVGSVLAGLPERLLESWRLLRMPTAFLPAPGRSDSGAEISLRESVMLDDEAKYQGDPESGYFQIQDVQQHSKIIERRLIAEVQDFLEEMGVNITEFVARTTAILNNGVINMGSGDVNLTNSPVGENASVGMQ